MRPLLLSAFWPREAQLHRQQLRIDAVGGLQRSASGHGEIEALPVTTGVLPLGRIPRQRARQLEQNLGSACLQRRAFTGSADKTLPNIACPRDRSSGIVSR
jgi:hypothetical protein